jgi:hypothetical protein
LDNKNDALYLASLLNAPITDKMIKPMQATGLWGPRVIHKKPLELPIPAFDSKDKAHQRLVELGKECSKKVEEWVKTEMPKDIKGIGVLRSRVRQMLALELAEIDGLVKGILR